MLWSLKLKDVHRRRFVTVWRDIRDIRRSLAVVITNYTNS